MPGGITRDNLPLHKTTQNRLRAPEYNAIAAALRPNQSGRQGFNSSGELVTRDPPRSRNRPHWCLAHEEIPAYSIFTLAGNVVHEAHDPVRFQSATWGINSTGSPLVFFTNDSITLEACEWWNVRPINQYDTALINWAGSTPPVVGMWCGVSLDGYTVEAGRFGFVVMGIEDDGTRVRIMQSDQPIAVVGVVTERITAFDPCSRELGKGKIRVEYRINQNDKLEDAGNPELCLGELGCEASGIGECGSGEEETTSFIVDVFNVEEREFPPSECYRLLAVNTLGIGLVVTKTVGEPPPTECCSSSSGESDSSSSSGSDSGSSSGSEGPPPEPTPECSITTRQVAHVYRDGNYLVHTYVRVTFGGGNCSAVFDGIERIYLCCDESSSSSDGSSGSGDECPCPTLCVNIGYEHAVNGEYTPSVSPNTWTDGTYVVGVLFVVSTGQYHWTISVLGIVLFYANETVANPGNPASCPWETTLWKDADGEELPFAPITCGECGEESSSSSSSSAGEELPEGFAMVTIPPGSITNNWFGRTWDWAGTYVMDQFISGDGGGTYESVPIMLTTSGGNVWLKVRLVNDDTSAYQPVLSFMWSSVDGFYGTRGQYRSADLGAQWDFTGTVFMPRYEDVVTPLEPFDDISDFTVIGLG